MIILDLFEHFTAFTIFGSLFSLFIIIFFILMFIHKKEIKFFCLGIFVFSIALIIPVYNLYQNSQKDLSTFENLDGYTSPSQVFDALADYEVNIIKRIQYLRSSKLEQSTIHDYDYLSNLFKEKEYLEFSSKKLKPDYLKRFNAYSKKEYITYDLEFFYPRSLDNYNKLKFLIKNIKKDGKITYLEILRLSSFSEQIVEEEDLILKQIELDKNKKDLLAPKE